MSRYIDQRECFVSLINSRPNRTTKIAAENVTNHDVPYLVSLSTNASSVCKACYEIGHTVLIPLRVPTFHKGYKIQYTETVFEFVANPSLNPPSYNIEDKSGQNIEAHFMNQN